MELALEGCENSTLRQHGLESRVFPYIIILCIPTGLGIPSWKNEINNEFQGSDLVVHGSSIKQ